MKRGAEQRVRKFLANTFKNDGPASVVNGEPSKGTSSFVIRFASMDGPLVGACCGLNISFYNTASRVFVGKSYRTEVGDAPIAFHAQTANTSIVIESVCVDQDCGDESVSCWWHAPLDGFSKATSLKLYKGCGQQLYLDSSVWPVPSLGVTLFFEVLIPDESQLFPSLIPPMVCVKEAYLESAVETRPFRVVAGRLVITEQMLSGATSMFEENGLWTAMIFAHNTHLMLSPVTEMSLAVDGNGDLISTKEVNFAALPHHQGTNLVCCLRFKKAHEARFRAVGFTCFDLVTGVPTFSDVDVNLTQLPFLKGPFSCEDPRCLSLEHEQPYAVVPLTMSVRLSYHNTPVPAPVWTEELMATPIPIPTPTPSVAVKEGAVEAETISQGKGRSRDREQSRSKADRSPPVSFVAPLAEMKGGITTGDNVDVYKLLCDIMEEVRQIKTMQAKFPSGLSKGPEGHMDPASPEMALTNMTAVQEKAVKVQELHLRPVALPRRRQAAIAEGMRPFCNPQTQQRVPEMGTVILPGDLPHDQLLLRFEGITFGTHDSPMPPSVTIAASYSALPPQLIGPISTRRVVDGDAEYGTSFQLSALDKTSGTGFMWCEPVESAANSSLKEAKANSNIYLHLFDATTMFYMASAILKPAKLQRSANAVMTSANFDLVLFEDLSMTERDVPETIPLIASTDVGYLHVTAALLGIPTPVGDKRVIGSGDADKENPSQGAQGGIVYVKKLPADFGDECKPRGLAAQPELRPQGMEGLSEQRANLHRMRANFVRGLLQNPDTTSLAVHINGGRIPTDNEHKLRYVEKRRDEVKSTKIAEALRARITTTHKVTAWIGAPRVVSTAFSNPFPTQCTFQVEVPTTSPFVSLHPGTGCILTLGPHESVNIKTVICVKDPAVDLAPFQTQIIVRTMQQEVSRIINFDVKMVLPVINRRYEIFGSPNELVEKRIHARAFPSSPNVAALGAMCHFCGVFGLGVRAETRAVVEPLSPAMVAAWEEVLIKATIPKEGSQKVYALLYKDAEMTECWEMWELTLTAATRFHTQEVFYGQTTLLTLPILCDRAYASDPHVTTVIHRDCVVLKVKPAREGVMTFHVQSLRGAVAERTIVTVPCVLPMPSFEDYIDIHFAQSGAPIHRLLTFTNREIRQKKFHVTTNYTSNITVRPAHFGLAPLEVKQLRIEIGGLNFLGREGRWPMWIFINDDEDLTVDSYRITVTVREGVPAIMSVM